MQKTVHCEWIKVLFFIKVPESYDIYSFNLIFISTNIIELNFNHSSNILDFINPWQDYAEWTLYQKVYAYFNETFIINSCRVRRLGRKYFTGFQVAKSVKALLRDNKNKQPRSLHYICRLSRVALSSNVYQFCIPKFRCFMRDMAMKRKP